MVISGRRLIDKYGDVKKGKTKQAVFFIEHNGEKVSPKIVLGSGLYELSRGDGKSIIVKNKGTSAVNKYRLKDGVFSGDLPGNMDIEVCNKGMVVVKGRGIEERVIGGKDALRQSGIRIGASAIKPVLSASQKSDMERFLRRMGVKIPPADSLYAEYNSKKDALMNRLSQDQRNKARGSRGSLSGNNVLDNIVGQNQEVHSADTVGIKKGFEYGKLKGLSASELKAIDEEHGRRWREVEAKNSEANQNKVSNLDLEICGKDFLSMEKIREELKKRK